MRWFLTGVVLSGAMLSGAALQAHAQTDWYNTDRGRPLRTEDALVVERHAFELQFAPVRVSRAGRHTQWQVEPELAWGVLPRTQVGLHVAVAGDAGLGLAGIGIGALHALNTESLWFPGLAVGAEVALPAVDRGPESVHTGVVLIATRTGALGRAHLNARTSFGDRDDARAHHARWEAGLALDRPLPLRSMLIATEVVAEEQLAGGPTGWSAGAGVRVQLTPRAGFDAGLHRTFAGPAVGWSVSAGSAVAFAIPSFQMRGVR